MPLWGRRLLIAVAIWATAMGYFYWEPLDSDVGNFLVALAGPVGLGLVLGGLANLPWWQVAGFLAFPGAGFLLFTVFQWHRILINDDPMPAAILFAIPALAWLITSWLFSRGFIWPKAGVCALVVAGFVASFPALDAHEEAEFREAIISTGAPLVAPVIPGFTLASTDGFPLSGIGLNYSSADRSDTIDVDVYPLTRDPGEMCRGIPDSNCEKIWVDTTVWGTRLYGRVAGTTLRIDAFEALGDTLLRGFEQAPRPITLDELTDLRR
ncbi:hypothetical protein [Herbidospora sp. RD11066]